MQTVYLVGAETVEKAASTILEAAREMQRAAEQMQYTYESHQRLLDQWLTDFREALKGGHKSH